MSEKVRARAYRCLDCEFEWWAIFDQTVCDDPLGESLDGSTGCGGNYIEEIKGEFYNAKNSSSNKSD